MRSILKAGLVAAGMLVPVLAQAEEVTLSYQGKTLLADLTLAEGKSVKDGLIVFTHGTLAHNKMEIVRSLGEMLAERGISTLSPTLSLGLDKRSGMYDCAVPHTHSHEDAIGEIAAWVGWAKGQGATDLVMMGHSRGGAQTAWYVAEKADPAISKTVLIAPATWTEAAEAKSYKTRYGADLKPLLDRAQALVKQGKGGEMMKDIGFIYCPGAQATSQAFVGYYAPDQRFDTPHLLPRIKMPVLIVAGSGDDVVPDLPARLKQSMPANVSFTLIDGADHFFADLYGEDVADSIAAFLEK